MLENCVSDLKLSARSLRDLFFPRKCVVCGRFLGLDEEDVCAACLDGLPMTYQWDIVQNAAFERLARRFEVQDAASLIFFAPESDYRHILYGIKYGNRRKLAVRMGELLGTKLSESRAFKGCQAVVPVPLHPLRRWKRGYNQAELIARGVAKPWACPSRRRSSGGGAIPRHRRSYRAPPKRKMFKALLPLTRTAPPTSSSKTSGTSCSSMRP